MMHCRKVLELLPKFIENDFSPSERAAVEAHLKECEACRLEFEAMARLVETLESLPPIGVPRSFKEAVMSALPPQKKHSDEK
jgi:predicted anti-sigma-YlaC factor YlaD